MRYRKHLYAILFIGAVVATSWAMKPTPPSFPKTVAEATAIAEARGFFVAGNTVSRSPITNDEANGMRVCRTEEWTGAARIVTNGHDKVQDAGGLAVSAWGKVLVYGDPDLVRELMAAR
jgi:hypothetical protein